jgi:D-alanine-D-alanine ligase
VIPGLTETSLLPQGLAAAGIEVGDLYRRLAESALAAADAH